MGILGCKAIADLAATASIGLWEAVGAWGLVFRTEGSIRIGVEKEMALSSCGCLPWWRAGQGALAAPEGLDHPHDAAAVGHGSRRVSGAMGSASVCRVGSTRLRRGVEQKAYRLDVGLASGAGDQAVVTDAMEAIGQHVHQEAADELVRSPAA